MVSEIELNTGEGGNKSNFIFGRNREPRTIELYESVWGDFERFCSSAKAEPLPATTETVIAFLQARASTHSISALVARRSAILAAHKEARKELSDVERRTYLLDEERIKAAWSEILRRKGNQRSSKARVGSNELIKILHEVPNDSLTGILDRAILLVGFACGLERAEIAALNFEDIQFTDDGMLVRVRRNKTDKGGVGVSLPVKRDGTENCPVTAMERWIGEGKVRQGHLFHHPKFRESRRINPVYVNLILQRYGERAGLDRKRLSARSLRRGAIMEGVEAGNDIKALSEAARLSLPGITRYFDAETRPLKSATVADDIESIKDDPTVRSETERAELIKARLGQGEFRRKLVERWNRRCAVTGCTVVEALRASHIQPWSESNNADRLNPSNGLLLIANLDALFDEYLISFQDDGKMLVSQRISGADARSLGLIGSLLAELTNGEKIFLAKHRAVFQSIERHTDRR